MNPTRINGQVHRFRDYVALHIGTGPTIYIKPDDARKFADALTHVAGNVDTHAGTYEFEFMGEV